MKIFKLVTVVLFLVVATAQTSLAQKIGHLNSDLLLSQMPQMKSANSQLEAFSKQKEKEIQAKNDAISKFYMETMQASQKGELSPKQQQEKEATLQKKQADLQKAQQSAQQQVIDKQSTLYQPIIDKVDNAIKSVAEEKGYDYIFNTNAGAVIHFNESDDVTNLVKAKLGM